MLINYFDNSSMLTTYQKKKKKKKKKKKEKKSHYRKDLLSSKFPDKCKKGFPRNFRR